MIVASAASASASVARVIGERCEEMWIRFSDSEAETPMPV